MTLFDLRIEHGHAPYFPTSDSYGYEEWMYYDGPMHGVFIQDDIVYNFVIAGEDDDNNTLDFAVTQITSEMKDELKHSLTSRTAQSSQRYLDLYAFVLDTCDWSIFTYNYKTGVTTEHSSKKSTFRNFYPDLI